MSSPVLSALPSPGLGADPDQTQARAKSKEKANPSPLFMAFWQVYPRKVARADAWKAWRQVGAESIAEKVTTAIAAQTEADFQFRPEDKVPQGASWLRAERWNDVVKARGNGFGEKTEKLIGAVRDWTPRKATS